LGRVLSLVPITEDQAGQSIGSVELATGQPEERLRDVSLTPV